ncbi:MAG TPA: type II secretion system F family protein [Thermoleophilaceae bacterium]|nr:type II secretion system F family protein [Thermoleophilaceae bacterium]
MSASVALAFLAGTGGALGCAQLVSHTPRRAPQVVRVAAELSAVLVRQGREGRDPAAAERRRLLLAGAAVTFLAGAALAGPVPGLALAAAGPWLAARVLRARRERYRAAVDAGCAQMAVAVADAVGGGHSLRSALSEAAQGLDGAAGHELRRTAAELATGARTDDALRSLRIRAGSERVDVFVAACILQRRAGGDLARLLRDCAAAMEEQGRLEGELRAATAQARFTGALVVLLPAGGALLAELASPGWLAGLTDSLLTVWLVGLALGLQALAAVLIHRLGRPAR